MNELYQINEVLKSGILSGFRATPDGHLGGKYVQLFEAEFCKYFGVKYAVSFNSATSALHASCVASGASFGDEVLVTPYSFSASATCALHANLVPVFVDIKPDIFCIDPTLIEQAITPKTKAIVVVHLFGHPADMDEIMDIAKRYNLFVIEDCAQAIGATYRNKLVGTIGDCGVFSFNQPKTINTGEGGMLITDNDKVAEIARAVRNHGEVSVPEQGILGWNYRMTEIEATIGIERFRKLDTLNIWRIGMAEYFTYKLKQFAGLLAPVVYPYCKHVFYNYAIKFNELAPGMTRSWFADKMEAMGVCFNRGYVKPLHLLPVYGQRWGLCPVAERMWRDEVLIADIFKPSFTLKDLDNIVDKMVEVLNG